MKYFSVFIAMGLAITVSMGTSVKADDTDDLLNQLSQLAASSKDAKDGNTDKATESLVKTLLQFCHTYLKQLDDMANETDTTAAKPADPTSATPAAPPETAASTTSASTATSANQAPAFQAVHVQPSGPFKEVHLPGYPALPDVPPTSSVSNVSATH